MRSWELKGYCAVVSIVMQSCHSNEGGHAFLPCEACVTKGKMPNVILQIVTLSFLTVKSMKVFTHSFIHSFILVFNIVFIYLFSKTRRDMKSKKSL